METHSHNHYHKQHPDTKKLSESLQKEVNLILENVDEKTLFAEFRQEEIFDIQNGDHKEVVRHTLDERIFSRTQAPRRMKPDSIERRAKTAKKIGKLKRFMRHLFKPLEY